MSKHEESAADVADAATDAGLSKVRVSRFVMRGFWWLAHHLVARPLAMAVPLPGTFKFSAWTLGRRNMQA